MENFTTTVDTVSTSRVAEELKESKDADNISDTERLVIVIMLSFLSVVGIIGNALAIYVFTNLKQKVINVTSTIFILTLAGTDFITCLITIPFTIAIESLKYLVAVDAICKVYHFLITTTVPFSCVVIVAIAVDRYMCICHPFHHWMTVQRARIIIGVLVCVIFMVGGIACMHYTIYSEVVIHLNTTAIPEMAYVLLNGSSALEQSLGNSTFHIFQDFTEAAFPGLNYTNSSDWMEENQTPHFLSPSRNITTRTMTKIGVCDVNTKAINKRFFVIFRNVYSAIFLVSCIIVLVLYSIIYRSVIAQRRKKLRIKSAQCCLLWNATSIDASQEAVEMTQDFELSQVNGEDRFIPRQNSGMVEYSETQNNGLMRKGSLSKARIEKMRVANIKTAFTLFIVTLVFIVAFLPSWLMALNYITMNVIVFYTHYVYNVVNPLIYAFLNQNFKTELRRIVRCQHH